MKRLGALLLSLVLLLGAAVPCLADTSDYYMTSSLTSDNYAELTLSGNTLSIRRRSDFKHDSSDHVRVLAGSQTLLQKEGKWTEYFFEDGHGYDLTLDLSTLPAEQATVKITSWNDKQTYNLLTVDILKAADGWHFDDTTALAQQYNYDLLRRLQNGQVPNDFAALKSQYGQTSDGAAVLAQIEAKALEVTTGCTDDRSKAEAINRWVIDNIAYDSDMVDNNYYEWIETHPEDEVRLDNPLHAFTEGYALCYGYAKLTTLMMGYAGVDCVYVTGRIPTEEDETIADVLAGASLQTVNHAWNVVRLDDRWYPIDTCLDSRSYYSRTDPEDPATGSSVTIGSPSYLNTFASLAAFSSNHVALRLGTQGSKITPTAVPAGWI